MYPDWLQRILNFLPKNFDYEKFVIHAPRAKHEISLNILIDNQELKKIMAICHKYSQIVDMIAIEHVELHKKGGVDPSLCAAHSQKIREQISMINQLINFFWQSVRSQYNVQQKNLGIREGWELVTWEDAPLTFIETELIQGPFGLISHN